MKLHFYQGLDDQKVPKDVTHVIVDNSVTVIKNSVFSNCEHLVSIIMGDNVKRIDVCAFFGCVALRFIRLSKTLECIGECAFFYCYSLEALFLPSTLTSIRVGAFYECRSLRLLILPNDIDLSNIENNIICDAGIHRIAENAGVAYEHDGQEIINYDSHRRVHEWLIHHMDEAPFHKLCCNSSVTTKQINDYLTENGTDTALTIDPYHAMTPLHMLSMNPHAPAEAIAALLDVNVEVVFRVDNQEKMPFNYARDYNVGGLVGMINGLCNHRHAA